MKALAREAHRLSDLLGDDHDLEVLREQVGQGGTRSALLSVIDRRRAALQRQALELGARIYKRRPKAFGRSVERGWHKRAAKHPQPVAS